MVNEPSLKGGRNERPRVKKHDAVVMDTPFVVLCKPDCRGLCPTCGINLNVEQCDCAARAEAEWAAATENPFAALKNLKLDE